MTAQELMSLAERMEGATGADRELDAKIARAVGRIPEAAAYEGTIKMGDLAWLNGCGYEVPAYTASLDAAMTLLPEAEAGYSATFWRVGNDGEGGDPAAFKADVLVCGMMTSQRYASVGATPALALCAASLRARASNAGGRG